MGAMSTEGLLTEDQANDIIRNATMVLNAAEATADAADIAHRRANEALNAAEVTANVADIVHQRANEALSAARNAHASASAFVAQVGVRMAKKATR